LYITASLFLLFSLTHALGIKKKKRGKKKKNIVTEERKKNRIDKKK